MNKLESKEYYMPDNKRSYQRLKKPWIRTKSGSDILTGGFLGGSFEEECEPKQCIPKYTKICYNVSIHVNTVGCFVFNI